MSKEKRIRVAREKEELNRRWYEEEEYAYGQHVQAPTLSDFIHLSDHLSEALKIKLIEQGITDPWMLNRAHIYQRAIVNLSKLLIESEVPEYLREAALSELLVLVDGMGKLFSGHTKRSKTYFTDTSSEADFYFQNSSGETKRISVYQRLTSQYSGFAQRALAASCQIYFKDIMGRSSSGRAIGGDDTNLRIGLRNAASATNRRWVVSIDSGINTFAENDSDEENGTWKVIDPLSQAIKIAKDQIDLSQTHDIPGYTFHYTDPGTLNVSDYCNRIKLREFNYGLAGIFQSL